MTEECLSGIFKDGFWMEGDHRPRIWRMGLHHWKRRNILRLLDLQQGKGLVKVNGQPLSLVQPEILRYKVRIIAQPTESRRRIDGSEFA